MNLNAEHKQRKDTISEDELNATIEAAGELPEFYRLRVCALVCLLWLIGKRRSEIARLELSDFEEVGDYLNVTITLSKKRKDTVLQTRVTKSIKTSDPVAQPILTYLKYLKSMDPLPRFFLPRTKSIFGSGFTIDVETGISDRQVYNLVNEVDPDTWPHLYRESAGAEIVKKDPTIVGVFKVKNRLDHKDLRTSLGYLERYANDVIDREAK